MLRRSAHYVRPIETTAGLADTRGNRIFGVQNVNGLLGKLAAANGGEGILFVRLSRDGVGLDFIWKFPIGVLVAEKAVVPRVLVLPSKGPHVQEMIFALLKTTSGSDVTSLMTFI